MPLGPKPLSPVERVIKWVGYRLGVNITYDGITRAELFRPGKGHRHIDKSLMEPSDWAIPARAVCDEYYRGNELYEIWRLVPGGDKWLHYFPIYEKLLSRYKAKSVRVLEIGVFRGASLKMLKRYLGGGAQIVGVDIDPKCKDLSDLDDSTSIEIGSQADRKFLRALIEKYGQFDVIIDDGSHVATHQITAFNTLFRDGLNDDGIYLVEDTHCSYWESHRNCRASMMDFAYSVIDLMHGHYVDFQRRFPYAPGDSPRIVTTNYLAQHLDHVTFHDSVIVFQKCPKKLPPLCVDT